MEKINIVEYFNKEGVCIKRTTNGIDLPADTEPSVFFMEDVKWAEQRTTMTKEEFNNRFPPTQL
jgi:hypothetical protein